jgi:glycosyltransferase involved in cell wall biosynthesis
MPQPLVSLIMPVRNEAKYIVPNLEAIAAQSYPQAQIEILIADGMSTDGTAALVEAFAAAHPQMTIRLIENPQLIKPPGFNKALAAASGEIIVMVDGHCLLASNYIQRCIEVLDQTQADCVGGVIETAGETTVAHAIALAQSSPFGVGGSAFRKANPSPSYVDTLLFGAYRRSVFERLGNFDEELMRNHDDEFNFRLTQSGGRIWLDPSIRAVYFNRSSLRKLWIQYYQYGLYKIRVIQKRGAVASWRHLAPMALVLACLFGLVLFAVSRRKVWLAPVLAYTVANSVASLVTVTQDLRRSQGLDALPYLPLAFATLHFAYGFGFLAGIWRWRQHGLPRFIVDNPLPQPGSKP